MGRWGSTPVYWFGGWEPRPGVTLGIAFAPDPASACLASFVGLLFAAALVFAWGFFDEVRSTFNVLMLLFLAAMQGFCLTRDVFNLFVWFEVMSVSAYALTGFSLKRASLAGAAQLHGLQLAGLDDDAGRHRPPLRPHRVRSTSTRCGPPWRGPGTTRW